MSHKIADLSRLFLSGEEHVVKEFQHVFERVLEAKLRSKEGRTYVAAKLAELDKAAEAKPNVESPSPVKPAVV